jgi:soluble lytic murein transglycosylase-like protein
MKNRITHTPLRNWSDYLIYFFYLSAIVVVMLYINDSKADQTEQIKRTIVKVALAEGVDPNLALAIAEVESRFNPQTVGTLGELGIYQLRPEFHSVSLKDTHGNIVTGIRYLAKLKRVCNFYGDAFFVCFNYGPTKRLKYPTLFPYYKKVMVAKDHIEKTNLIATRD